MGAARRKQQHRHGKDFMATDPLTIALTTGGLTLTAALAGQLIAGCISNANNAKAEKRVFEQKRKSMTLQIYAEVHAALVIIKERGYIEGFEAALIRLEKNPNEKVNYEVLVADESFPIFKANVGNLGVMPSQLLAPVVTFYTLVLSLVQDVKPGGLLAREGSKRGFEEALELGRRAVKVGELIVQQVEALYPEVVQQATT